MRILATLTLITSLTTTAAIAETEGKRLATLAFQDTDGNSDGFVTMEEYQSHMGDVFFSMDSDQDERLVWDEFRNWGLGMENIAEDADRLEAYDTARKIVFDLWDRSLDWTIDADEQRRGVASDFFLSDENKDGRLSEEEYLRYSIQNVTFRSALHPET